MSGVSGDLLSSSSLLLGAIGFPYSVWYPEISAAKTSKIPDHDRSNVERTTKSALVGRAYPILTVSAALIVLLAAPAIDVVSGVIDYWRSPNSKAHYDAVPACFLLVYVLVFVIGVTISTSVIALHLHLKKIRTG